MHYFTVDEATVSIHTDQSGVADSSHGGIDWSDVERVTVDDPPYADAFETRDFYRLRATVARPIPQRYVRNDGVQTLMKPRDELRRAAWSLESTPWTLGHPETKIVADASDVRGYWTDPMYIDGTDDLDAYLHVPTTDDEAQSFLSDHREVSVGFWNDEVAVADYDGSLATADASVDELDGLQTDMLFNHVASVQVGRCSATHGCGIDDAPHGHVVDGGFISDTRIKKEHEGDVSDSMTRSTVDQPDGIHVDDGMWFAVGPDEHPDETTEHPGDAKFPVNTCADVTDAWNLRGTGTIDISQETLEQRIKRAAEAKDCELPDTAETDAAAIKASARRYSVCGSTATDADDTPNQHDTNTMSDTIELAVDDLSVDAALAHVAEQHDGVADRLDELRAHEELASTATDAADELDLDDPSELTDSVALLQERAEELDAEIDELEDELSALQRPQLEEDAAFIADRTDRFGDDADEVIEHFDEDADELASKRELLEDLGGEPSEVTATADSADDNTDGLTVDNRGYAKTPW